jgi:formate dehydrogenase major subunit
MSCPATGTCRIRRSASFDAAWGVTLQAGRLRIRTCSMRRSTAASRRSAGRDFVQSDPNTQHVTAALSAMEHVVVQDIFLTETAQYAHVFLPGSSFLEKDGTFTNAERRISRVRRVMPPLSGKADWEVTCALSSALGYHGPHIPPRSAGSARYRPARRRLKLDRLGVCSGRATKTPARRAPIMPSTASYGQGQIPDRSTSRRTKVTRRFPLS